MNQYLTNLLIDKNINVTINDYVELLNALSPDPLDDIIVNDVLSVIISTHVHQSILQKYNICNNSEESKYLIQDYSSRYNYSYIILFDGSISFPTSLFILIICNTTYNLYEIYTIIETYKTAYEEYQYLLFQKLQTIINFDKLIYCYTLQKTDNNYIYIINSIILDAVEKINEDSNNNIDF